MKGKGGELRPPSALPKKERLGLGACDGAFVSREEKTARDRHDIPT